MPTALRGARKRPQQERSRATYEAILVAAARVFGAKGYQAATMTEIATAAGVGIGSLYQYVPTKSDLATEVMKRRSEDVGELLDRSLLAIAGLPLAEALPKAMRAVIEAHRLHERIPHLALHEHARRDILSEVREIGLRVAIGLRVYLETRRHEIGPKNLELVVVLMTHMTDAAVHAAMVHQPTSLDDGVLEQELTDIWLRYLQAGRE